MFMTPLFFADPRPREDAVRFEAGDANLYRYVRNHPVKEV
jgi:hypothetical protein